jgi:hypothetical protein
MGDGFIFQRHPLETQLRFFIPYNVCNASFQEANAPLLQVKFIGIFFYYAHTCLINFPVLHPHNRYYQYLQPDIVCICIYRCHHNCCLVDHRRLQPDADPKLRIGADALFQLDSGQPILQPKFNSYLYVPAGMFPTRPTKAGVTALLSFTIIINVLCLDL